jgi:hypothetical protein
MPTSSASISASAAASKASPISAGDRSSGSASSGTNSAGRRPSVIGEQLAELRPAHRPHVGAKGGFIERFGVDQHAVHIEPDRPRHRAQCCSLAVVADCRRRRLDGRSPSGAAQSLAPGTRWATLHGRHWPSSSTQSVSGVDATRIFERPLLLPSPPPPDEEAYRSTLSRPLIRTRTGSASHQCWFSTDPGPPVSLSLLYRSSSGARSPGPRPTRAGWAQVPRTRSTTGRDRRPLPPPRPTRRRNSSSPGRSRSEA